MTGIERSAMDIICHARHNASGPPTSAYQVPNGPRPLQSTRTGRLPQSLLVALNDRERSGQPTFG
jgi:hypothetical protein